MTPRFIGTLKKMKSQHVIPIEYQLVFLDDLLCVNQLIGRKISISHQGYECLNCQSTQEIFRMGMCKRCFYKNPATADWVIRPELSKAHLDIEDRNLKYERKVQIQPHIVYLAFTGDVKVGVTRKSQVPTRWIDQGAEFAMPVLETPNRYLAGIAEVLLKEYFSDKTNWRNMLKSKKQEVSFDEERARIKLLLTEELAPYFLENSPLISLQYPLNDNPEKPKSLNLKNTNSYEGVLKGIKGQYFIFEDQTVLNIRSHEGFVVSISLD